MNSHRLPQPAGYIFQATTLTLPKYAKKTAYVRDRSPAHRSRSSRSSAQRSRSPIPKARPTRAGSSTDHLKPKPPVRPPPTPPGRQESVDEQMMSDVEKRELAAEREERAAEREAIERELAAEREERERELVAEREAIASKERELTMLREIDALQTSLSSKYTGLPLVIEVVERELAEMKARLDAEVVEPTNAEAVVEPTDVAAEDFT